MAVNNLRQRLVAFVAGLILGPAVVWAGLETGTYISDLVVTNPLGSDLASTLDDHLRLLKSTIKATFPNINGAVTVTDEQLNTVATNVAANPTGTIGLTAVNGSAATYLRSDGAPALSQAITPTWTGTHTFTKTGGGSAGAVYLSAAFPFATWNATGDSANNKRWQMGVSAEQFLFQTLSDADGSAASIMTVDRTSTTVDRVAFPTTTGLSLVVGTAFATPSSGAPMTQFNPAATRPAAAFKNNSATVPTVYIGSDQTGGNVYAQFYDGNDPDSSTGSISTNGTTTSYNTTSDERLKMNIKPALSARPLIDCIDIWQYDWRESGKHVDHGVVAQRLEKCAPYAVSKGKLWQVDKSTLIPALIKYVQEQDARIARLEANAARRH